MSIYPFSCVCNVYATNGINQISEKPEITGSVGSRSHDFRVANVNKEIISAKQRGTQMQKNTPWNACIPRALFFCIYATTVATEMKQSGIEVPRCVPRKDTFPGGPNPLYGLSQKNDLAGYLKKKK